MFLTISGNIGINCFLFQSQATQLVIKRMSQEVNSALPRV